MTKRERAAVTELLRCAADNDTRAGCGLIGMFNSPTDDVRISKLAWKALFGFTWPPQDWTDSAVDEGYRHALLEAALREETGVWPGYTAGVEELDVYDPEDESIVEVEKAMANDDGARATVSF